MNQKLDDGMVATIRQAWVDTRMEKDKTLLTLATGGIGVITTLATTVGPGSKAELVLYGLAAISFVVTIIAAVLIFDANSRHLEEVLLKQTTDDDPDLQWLDRVLFASFVVGVMLACAIALTAGYTHIRKDHKVAEQKLNESFSGIGRLQNTAVTGAPEKKSLTGIGRLQNVGTGTQSGSGSAAGSGTATGGTASTGSGQSGK
jgi:uncharacterized membrane protein YgcG